MKFNYLSISVFLSVIFSQFSTNMLNGFGDNRDVTSTFSESMGQMWMNNTNKNNWDPLLASSIHNTNLTMICVASSLVGNKTNNYQVNKHHFEFINFSFPFRETMGISIGFSPYTRTDYMFEEEAKMINSVEFSTPLLSNSSYIIKGGISKLSLGLSQGVIFNNISISMGYKWNILFGNQDFNSITMLKEVSYDQNGEETLTLIETLYSDVSNNFNAYQYEIDSRISIDKKNNFSFLMSLIDNFTVNSDEVDQLFLYSGDYSINGIQLDRLGFGYMYNKNDDFGLAFEGHLKNSIDYPKNVMLFNSSYPSQLSFHNGLYKRFNNIKSGSWNSINLSGGYSYKIIKFTNQDLKDISFSFGVGISFNESKNNVDISFTIGSSENILATIGHNNYYKLNVALISGDQWFKKRRRK